MGGAGGGGVYYGQYCGSTPKIRKMYEEINGGTFTTTISDGTLTIQGGYSNEVGVTIFYTKGVTIT